MTRYRRPSSRGQQDKRCRPCQQEKCWNCKNIRICPCTHPSSLDPAIYPQSQFDADHRSGMEDVR